MSLRWPRRRSLLLLALAVSLVGVSRRLSRGERVSEVSGGGPTLTTRQAQCQPQTVLADGVAPLVIANVEQLGESDACSTAGGPVPHAPPQLAGHVHGAGDERDRVARACQLDGADRVLVPREGGGTRGTHHLREVLLLGASLAPLGPGDPHVGYVPNSSELAGQNKVLLASSLITRTRPNPVAHECALRNRLIHQPLLVFGLPRSSEVIKQEH